MTCNQNFSDLREGKVDLIAMNLTVTAERKSEVAFTAPLLQTRQVLVQRKPELWEKMNSQRESALVRNQLDLAGENGLCAGRIGICSPLTLPFQ